MSPLEIVVGPISFFFFFLPFHLSHLRPIKKNQRLGQRIGCCGFVNFLGASRMPMNFVGLCFKLRTEVVVVGIGDWRKKKERKKKRNAWVEVFGFGRKWCDEMVWGGYANRNAWHVAQVWVPPKVEKNWVMRNWKRVPNGWV